MKSPLNLDQSSLLENGFVVINFPKSRYLEEVQKQIKSSFNFDPMEFHFQNMDDDKRLSLLKSVKNLLLDNLGCFEKLTSDSRWY